MALTKASSPTGTDDKRNRVNVGQKERNASMAGGAALAVSGLKNIANRRYLSGLAKLVAGGMFFYRGTTGHCQVYQAAGIDTTGAGDTGVQVVKFLTINRPPLQVYQFWHNLENLPRFMRHLESVRMTGETTSHWKARGPGGITLEWDAEMVEDYPGQLILWHSVADAELPNEGTVEFRDAPGGRGTQVKVSIRYYPPGGRAGKAAAKLANLISAWQIGEDLKRLKQILEAGESADAEKIAAAG